MSLPANTAATSTLDVARGYLGRGWRIVPIPSGAKAPRILGWPNLRLAEADLPAHFADGENIGVLLGAASGGLVDVDSDCLQAIATAQMLLRPTDMIHGRPSKPQSHQWYVAQPVPQPARFCDIDGTCLVELRSEGQQTIVPPSTHPTGERLAWEFTGEPAKVDGNVLALSVRRLAAAALIARHWPNPGTRNDAANALAGMLLRAGLSEEESEQFVTAVTKAAGDEESRQRVRDVISTEKRLAAGQAATGTPTLAVLIGDEVVRRAREWLGINWHLESQNSAVTAEWPTPLDGRAYYGLAGEVVSTIEPHTEADPAVLIQLLSLFGNVIGRSAHFYVEGTRHFANLFTVLVGTTSKGRKGSSFSQVERLFAAVDSDWFGSRIHRGGLSSGEGVIWAVRDPVERPERVSKRGESPRYDIVLTDPGISDKRLLIFEPEFATVLRVNEREGNTLSAVIREAWDSGILACLTKNSPAKATGAHVSIIGHVTKDELLRYLTTTEAASGFANRFLFLCVRRSKFLPEGSAIPEGILTTLREKLAKAVTGAAEIDSMKRDEEARAVWFEVYPALSAGQPGLFGAVTARGEAQVLRLSMLYALLDGSSVIRRQHLLAALALWEYAEESARFIFGDTLGDPTSDQILKALRGSDSGLTRTEISGLFGRHRSATDIERALRSLSSLGFVQKEARHTEGRPTEVWVCADGAKKANYAK